MSGDQSRRHIKSEGTKRYVFLNFLKKHLKKIKNMEIRIRPAENADMEAVWQMWKVIMEQKIYYPYADNYPRAEIEKSWINLKNYVFVATQGEEIVGAYIFKANQPGYGGHIANAAYMVKNDKRGQRIGHQLCEHSIEAAKIAGFRAMQFNLVASTNKSAVKTWLDCGFEIIGTVPEGFYHFDQGYVDAYIFYRKL
jgi:ribosomal protein S18 acetylase RimI-like enzyme